MKRNTLVYWIVTSLMAGFMTLSAVPDVLLHPAAIALMQHLGYPIYLIPFLGVLKLLAVGLILAPPRWPRLREWAYAGLTIDVTGALYSAIAIGDGPSAWLMPSIGLALILGAYTLYHRKYSTRLKTA